MNARDAISEELLSAYLDGELTPEEGAAVERALAESEASRRVLERLRWLARELARLPRERPDDARADRVIARLRDVAIADGPSPEDWSEDLLSGYLDGELNQDEREQVESRLARYPDEARCLDELRELQADLTRMPQHRLDESFTDRILAAVAEVDRRVPQAPAEPQVLVRRDQPAAGGRRRSLLWGLAAVSAAVLLLISAWPFDHTEPTPDIAEIPPGGFGGEVPGRSAVEPAPHSSDGLGPQDRNLAEGPGGQTMPPVPGSSPLSWVSHLGTELLFVYELTVTPEGVQADAFPQLLERHRIDVQQRSYPLDQRQRQLLLRHRFLDGVRSIDEDSANMDAVHVYLVSCQVKEAEAMYQDLMLRPDHFGSFFLNLTNRFAHEGVLNQICEDAGVEQQPRRAVELLGEFAILSAAARNLGAFGLMRSNWDDWIVPGRPRAEPPETTELDEEDWIASMRGEEACEVLFVVRHLQPLDDDAASDR